MPATVRFASLLEKGGRPTVYLAWMVPEKDRLFLRALREHRVLTIHQQMRGGKKDFAEVGFKKESGSQFLIFPRSLRSFENAKVIGIDYSLFEGSLSEGSILGQAEAKESKHSKRKAKDAASTLPKAEVIPFFPVIEAEKKVVPVPKPRRKIRVSPAARREIARALSAWQNGDPVEAEATLRTMLE